MTGGATTADGKDVSLRDWVARLRCDASQPVRPDYRKGLPVEWWASSGYCTRRAPSPAAEDDRKVYWPVTHAADSCGDGAQVDVDTVDTSDNVPALEDARV
jgi:hypothetical protein